MIPKSQLAGLTAKQQRFVEAIDANTEGLTAISTGICPGCEQCRSEHGLKVACECGAPHAEGPYCDMCDDSGKRPPTAEEFDEQWSNGQVFAEPSFSWHGCDLCGSTLGGDFEPWHAVDKDGEIIHGERACIDCVAYLANGDLPE